jgi:predicted O-methyltransferase YrrM
MRGLEVGFNGGHSAAMFLSLTGLNYKLDAYDICAHSYTIPAAELIAQRFPHRFRLTCGDSQITLWDKVNQQQQRDYSRQSITQLLPDLYDFSFIDGLHTFEGALSDLKAARLLSKKGGIVVLDDCFDEPVLYAWLQMVDEGLVSPLNQGLCWREICIGKWA